MKQIFTLFLALMYITGTWAEEVTLEQAQEQALNFLTNHAKPSGKPRRAHGTTPQLKLADKVSGLYIFNVDDDGGFVVVSNDDRTIPVLGFSESGNFNADNMPHNMRAWLQGYADEIEWLKKNNPKTSAPRPSNKVGSHSTQAVSPLCTSKWYQDAPYNNLCPTYDDGWYGSSRSVTGCVATAMAQIMYYHKWPETTKKTIPGYTTYSYDISLPSLGITTFDWQHMKDSYSGSYTNIEATAVATLMKYCGYSVRMDYGPSSGAYTEDVAIALTEYFDYNPHTTRFVSRSSYTYANWTDLMYYEVSHNRPVCYGGLSSGGGHEFVCDGYKFENNTDFFHINWGWGGTSDNYFVLSALDPDVQGIGGSTSTDGFHYGQDAVIGIQKSTSSGTMANIPANVVDLTVNSISLSRNPVEPNTTVSITFNITNNSPDPYDGDLWLSLREDGTDYLVELESVLIPSGATQDVVIPYSPSQVGTYTFLLAYINSEGAYVTYEGQQATLTVAENLTNGIVPVYGYWTDNYSRSQFIIGEADMEDIVGGEINAMTFYASESSVSWGVAKFDVYLKEVEESTISALKTWNTLNKVYSGSLSIVDNKMTITFNQPYEYQGGNLLVGINQTVSGSYQKCSWFGQTVTGVSVGGYGTSISQQNFLPDVTFDYTPGTGIHVKKPKDLAVSYVGGDEAIVSWTSDAPSFDIEVNGLLTEDVSNPCTLTGLEFATTYTVRVRAKNQDVVSDWTDPVSFTTNLSGDMCQIRLELSDAMGDGWNGAAIMVVDVITSTELGTFTNTNEVGKNVAQVYYLEVPNDRDIEFQWINGTYDQECNYAAYDVNGRLIFSGSKRLKEPVTYHVDCSLVTVVTLADTNNNETLIESLDGTNGCEVTLQGRTLYKDNTWNTICLPFDIMIAESPLADADVRALEDASLSGETVTLNFTKPGEINEIKAGTPYIIKWADGENLQNPVFMNVTIDKTRHDVACPLNLADAETTPISITFKGKYDYTSFKEMDRSILFVGDNNMLFYPLNGASLGAQRAFFQLEGFLVSEGPNFAKRYLLNIEEDDATGLHLLQDGTRDAEWYDLNGRRLSGKPTQRGIYIQKGNKVSVH